MREIREVNVLDFIFDSEREARRAAQDLVDWYVSRIECVTAARLVVEHRFRFPWHYDWSHPTPMIVHAVKEWPGKEDRLAIYGATSDGTVTKDRLAVGDHGMSFTVAPGWREPTNETVRAWRRLRSRGSITFDEALDQFSEAARALWPEDIWFLLRRFGRVHLAERWGTERSVDEVPEIYNWRSGLREAARSVLARPSRHVIDYLDSSTVRHLRGELPLTPGTYIAYYLAIKWSAGYAKTFNRQLDILCRARVARPVGSAGRSTAYIWTIPHPGLVEAARVEE